MRTAAVICRRRSSFPERATNGRDISPEQDASIRALLVSAFSRESAEHFRTSSYWGPRPTHRLWLEDRDQAIVAHLDLETRTIQVGDVDVLVAGVGEVATAPGL